MTNNLTPLVPADLDQLRTLEKSYADGWSRRQLADEFLVEAGWRLALRNDADGRIVGYALGRQVAGEVEVLRLAVAPDERRRGLGTRLLTALLGWLAEKDIRACFLEVRRSNLPARRLYEKCGFAVAGLRKAYYTDPKEDAILMQILIEHGEMK